MNNNQFDLITRLQSGLNAVRDRTTEDLTKEFNAAMDKFVEVSEDPKIDGEENFRKLVDMKEEFEQGLKAVFEKLENELNSL